MTKSWILNQYKSWRKKNKKSTEWWIFWKKSTAAFSQTFYKLAVTTCGLVWWIRIVKSQGVSLHLLANSFPRHFFKCTDPNMPKAGQGKNSERDFPLEFAGPSPSVRQWRLQRRAEGKPSEAHLEALSREVPDCKRFMKRLKNKKKKKKFLQDTLNFDPVQCRGCPEVSTGKLSRGSTPKIQRAKSKTGGKKELTSDSQSK